MADEKTPAGGSGSAASKEKKATSRIPSAKKRDLQSKRRNLTNRGFKARVTTAVRAFTDSLASGDKAVAREKLNQVNSLLDKGVKTNKYKLNKASRTKSRLASRLGA